MPSDFFVFLQNIALFCLRALLGKAAKSFLSHSLQSSIRHVVNDSPTYQNTDDLPIHTTASSRTESGGTLAWTGVTSLPIAEILFYVAFSESCVLCLLVLLQGAFNDSVLWFNWNWSLGVLVFLIVFIAPFLQCLLFALNRRGGGSISSISGEALIFASSLYAVGLILFFWIGNIIARTLGVSAGSEAFGLFNALLQRICVPGIFLVALLSGAGAIHTAYDAYEWRKTGKGKATQEDVDVAEHSLERVRKQIRAREAEINTSTGSSANDDSGKTSLLGRFLPFGGQPSKVKSLEAEISGLRSMEAQFISDIDVVRRRKDIYEQSKTLYGRFFQLFGYAFSLYCAYRIMMAAANLVFGLSSSSNSRQDIITSALIIITNWLNISIDIITWVKFIGFALTGGIVVVNLNSVLYYVSRSFRAISTTTSTSSSTAFLLLFLAQLLALYMITSLISLPREEDKMQHDPSAPDVLDTLPDFAIFSKMFDVIFLLAALTWFILRYIQRQVRLVDEPDFDAFHLAVPVQASSNHRTPV